MSLTEAEKRKIEEEEAYRARIRTSPVAKNKAVSLLSKIAIVIAVMVFLSIMLVVANPPKSRDNPKQTSIPTSTQTQTQIQTTTVTPVSTKIPMPTEPPCMQAKVALGTTQIQITNLGSRDWTDTIIKINSGLFSGGYQYRAGVVPAGEVITIGLANFTKGDERFNPFEKAVKDVYIVDRDTLCDYEVVAR